METIDGNTITSETLAGVFSSFHPNDDSQEILKPTSEEKVGEDLPPENEVLTAEVGAAAAGDGGGGGGPVVVTTTTTTVIEKTQISVVIQEVKNDDVLKNQEVEEGFEIEEKEKEGFFSNLVGGDDENMEFMDANISFSCENGSELMEGEKQENGEEIVESGVESGVVSEEKKLVSEENVVSEPMEVEKQENGAEIVESGGVSEKKKSVSKENVVSEPMEVEKQENGAEIVESGAVSEKKKFVSEENVVSEPMEVEKHEKGAEIIESGVDLEKNNEGNTVETKPENVEKPDTKSENQENGQDSGNKSPVNDNERDETEEENEEEEEDHDFVIGDFVWGKIKSHPWWPGQIYDPLDASEYAVTLKRKNHLLVAYFGDGSFSWCSPSQLKPFIDSFEEMSKQSDSKKFVNAVQKGLEAVGKLVEAEMSCKCWNFDKNGGGSVAVNSGIKAGVGMPKGNTIKILVDRMNPMEVFRVLKGYATMDPSVKMAELELTVLKSCLTAFYHRKNGQFSLPEYHDPKYIEGLEDGTRSGFVSDSDFNGPSESGDGNSHQKRKQKSVAELLGDGGEDERKMKKVKTSGGGGSGSRGLKREQKRKALVVSVSPESDLDSGGIGMEEETMMSSPRQRKKSKYLSPPYTSPIWTGGKLSASSSFKEMKTESSEKVPEMAAKHLEDSLKRSSASGRKSRSHNHRGRPRDGHDSQDSKEDEKTIIDAAVNVNKVLDGLLRAALDPSSFVVEKKKVPEVSEFISAFRSSVFEDGSNEKKPVSDLEFIERKLESIREMVKGCEEGEISEEVKGDLEEGIEEVLEKVKKMK